MDAAEGWAMVITGDEDISVLAHVDKSAQSAMTLWERRSRRKKTDGWSLRCIPGKEPRVFLVF